MHSCHLITGRSLVRLVRVWQPCKLYTEEPQRISITLDHRAHTVQTQTAAICRDPLFEFVCSSLSLLVIVVFCFVLFSMQMWCNILIFFGSKLDWRLYCVLVLCPNVRYSSCEWRLLLFIPVSATSGSYRFFYQSSLSQWNCTLLCDYDP